MFKNFLTLAGGILAAGLLWSFWIWNATRFGYLVAALGVLAAVLGGFAVALWMVPDEILLEYVEE